jgi:2-dehydropantoate 2-reductase
VRIVVVGPGAIGTLLAVRLAVSGASVRLVPRPGTRPALPTAEFRIEGVDPAVARVEVADPGRPLEPADAAVLAVKGFDLPQAAVALSGLVGAPILLPQNGLGIEELAARGLRRAGSLGGAPPLVRAINTLPATLLGPGRVRQAGSGGMLLDGDPPEPLGKATALWGTVLETAGIAVKRVPEFDREIWRKLLVNAAINPVTADHGVENGRLAEDPWRGQALTLLEEARAVAALEGFEFTEADAERELFTVVRATASNRSSMLQDLDHHRSTEVDTISGAILERARRHGLTLPATQRIVDRIHRRTAASADASGSAKRS